MDLLKMMKLILMKHLVLIEMNQHLPQILYGVFLKVKNGVLLLNTLV